MIYQFRLASDDSLWVFNTADMTWGKASEILSAPSMSAVEAHLAKFEFSESGTLVAQGAGAYTFDGRTPKDGICSVGILPVLFEDALYVFLKTNVPAKDESFKSNCPAEMQKFVKHKIMAPEADNTPQVKLA